MIKYEIYFLVLLQYYVCQIKQKNIDTYNNAGKIYVPISGKIIETFLSVLDFFKLLLIKNNNYINISHEILDKEINLDERI